MTLLEFADKHAAGLGLLAMVAILVFGAVLGNLAMRPRK